MSRWSRDELESVRSNFQCGLGDANAALLKYAGGAHEQGLVVQADG